MYFSNTTLFDGAGIYSIYNIRYNYMFRRLTMVIFRLYMKYLLSNYTRLIWVVYSEKVGGEVSKRSRMCHRGLEVWLHGGTVLLYVMSKLILLGLWYHIMCVVELY